MVESDWRQYLGLFLLLSVILGLAGCSPPAELPPEQAAVPELPFAQELQKALDRSLSASQGDYDLGISAAVSLPGFKRWSGVSGNSQPGVALSPDMLFDAGSIAKNFEAALVLKLLEQDVLHLDDPVSRWLPPIPNVDEEITIRQLLNHTSGLFNVFEHPDFPWVGPDVDYAKRWDLNEVFARFVLEPYGPPGQVQHYSSTNYLLLTAIIEQATGSSVPQQVNRYFFEPLDLEHSFMVNGEPLPGHFTTAHPWVDVNKDGELEDLAGIPLTWKATLSHPVLFTTPADLVVWLNALYHDRSVLAPEAMEEMLTIPDVSETDPEGGLYGLGVVDYSEVLGMKVIGHGGSSLGYSAAALYLPEYGASLAWTINTGESPTELAESLMGNTWSSLSEVLQANLESIR